MGALTTTGGIEQGRPPTNRQLRKHDILLLTHPRTASNLLTRLLSTQAGWIQKEYHFRGAFKFSRESCTWDESLLNISCDEDRQQFESLFQKGLAKLCTDRDAARAEVCCTMRFLWILGVSIWGLNLVWGTHILTV